VILEQVSCRPSPPVKRNALLLPLGRAAEGCLRLLVDSGQLDQSRCLFGFPHPSGANGLAAAPRRCC
jgi:hypothetical protein